jgi:hypothetical protein
MDLRDAFNESDLPILVDILDWVLIPESFHTEIKRNHLILYSPTTSPHPYNDNSQ